MAGRIRTIKPEWLEDSKMVLSSPEARAMSICLILEADDYGRGVGNEAILVSRTFPGHSRLGISALKELRKMNYVRFYEVRGQTFFEITNWARHQRVDKPGKPRVPCACGSLDAGHAKVPDCHAKVPGSLAPDHDHDHDHDHDLLFNGVERAHASSSLDFDFESAYLRYPRKQGKAKGLVAARKLIRSKAEFERFAEALERMAGIWDGASQDEFQFCPIFSTFVNQERWKDEQLPAPNGKLVTQNGKRSGDILSELMRDD